VVPKVWKRRWHPEKESGSVTKKEQARYRAIMRELARLREAGWDRTTHPDFEPLDKELAVLAEKITETT
jgi:hypothetical protein